jgi:hypothetical protein
MRIILIVIVIILQFQFAFTQNTEVTVTQSQGVGVNMQVPTNYFHVDVPATYFNDGIFCEINRQGNYDTRAVKGLSIPNPGYGIGGHFTGGFRGVYAFGNGGTYSNTQYSVYGIYAESTGSAGSRIGAYSRAIGGDTNIGLFTEASGGDVNLAAKFGDGDVEFENLIRVNSTNSTGRLTLSNTDNIGSYAAALRIYASNNGPETTYGSFVNASNSGTGNSIGYRAITYDVGDFAFWGEGDSFFSGDVRIGQNVDPVGLYKLIVDGRVLCEEVRVQNSLDWPDYVFDDEYKLMTLSEVEKYIKIHNHLPNIPTASEIEEEGIVIGEMQVKLMEKVEELTLHLIAQQKEIDTLKNQVKDLTDEK